MSDCEKQNEKYKRLTEEKIYPLLWRMAIPSMIGMLTGMLVNIILDPVFILLFDMGVAGAALASLLGQVSGLFVLLILARRNGNVAGGIGNVRPSFIYIREILAGGAPNFVVRESVVYPRSFLIRQQDIMEKAV